MDGDWCNRDICAFCAYTITNYINHCQILEGQTAHCNTLESLCSTITKFINRYYFACYTLYTYNDKIWAYVTSVRSVNENIVLLSFLKRRNLAIRHTERDRRESNSCIVLLLLSSSCKNNPRIPHPCLVFRISRSVSGVFSESRVAVAGCRRGGGRKERGFAVDESKERERESERGDAGKGKSRWAILILQQQTGERPHFIAYQT